MAQVQSDKCTLAWFRLAEFVARREKERALGIYRLLVHSLPDEAIAAQLEGDLLLAFNDAKALACYEKAALLHEQAQNYTEAIAIYEHCILIVKTYAWANRAVLPEKYHKRLIRLLMCAGKVFKAVQVLELCSKKLLEAKNNKEALDLAYMLVVEYPEYVQFNAFYEQLFFSTIDIECSSLASPSLILPDYIKEHVAILTKRHITLNSGQQLNAFLSRIAALCGPAHEYALETAQALKI